MAQTQMQPLPVAAVRRPSGVVLQLHTVSNADQVDGHSVAFRHAYNGIPYERPRGAPHLALQLLRRLGDGELHGVFHGEVDLHVVLQQHRGGPQRPGDLHLGGGGGDGDGGRELDGLASDDGHIFERRRCCAEGAAREVDNWLPE